MIKFCVLESRLRHKHPVLMALTLGILMLIPSMASALSPQVPIEKYERASELINQADYYPLSQASAHLQKGENAESLVYLLESLEKNPINILSLFHLGTAYLELAKQSTLPPQQMVYLEQAQQAFERVVDLNSDLTLVYFKLGKIALMKNDLPAAKHYYETGLQIEPNNAALIFNLARVYDQNQERDKAIEHYRKTVAADPNFTYAYNNLALLYEESKDYKNAERAYRQALKKDKKYNLARLNLGNMLAATGHYEQANQLFTEALAQEPENEWGYYYQGNMYLRMGSHAQAADAYRKVIELNPTRPTVYYLLAVCLSKTNQMDEALHAGMQYMQLAPNGEYAKEMKTLIMAVKLSQSRNVFFTKTQEPPARP